jgi:NAD(P)H-flavin reductase/hemoglobin-like flavoprotein
VDSWSDATHTGESDPVTMMNSSTVVMPSQAELTELASALRASWAEVEKLGDYPGAYFYATLFTLDPSLRDMFPAAMGAQRDRLLAALGHIVSHVDDGPTLTTFLGQLGRDHRRFDVRPEHYPIVGQALLHTLAHGLGPAWTSDLADKWATAYDLVSRLMIEAANESAKREPARWDAEILTHERRAGDIAVITARIAGKYHWQPGQSFAVESHLRPRVWRYFTPATLPRADGTVEFHVRAVPGGQLSPALVYHAQVGDVLRISAPTGTALTLPPGAGPDLLMLAGGTGVAPMKGIVEQLIQQRDPRRVNLFVGASYRFELYDMEALQSLARQHPALTVQPVLSMDPSMGEPATVVEAALQQGSWQDRLILVCGSPGMVSGTVHMLTQHGYLPEQIRTEQYDGTSYAPIQAGAGTGARVSYE